MTAPGDAAGGLPGAIQTHPRLGQWLGLTADQQLIAYSGKVDIGQGISHALACLVARELQMNPNAICMVPASTRCSPDEAVTSGSLSVQESGAALVAAASCLRELCREAFAVQHGVSRHAVVFEAGVFSAPGLATSNTCLALVNQAMFSNSIAAPLSSLMQSREFKADLAPPRPDIAAKVFGEFRYIQDRVLPGMCFGQVFRPTILAAEVNEAHIADLLHVLRGLDGVTQVVRDGLLVGVVAESEPPLKLAARQVEKLAERAVWWEGSADAPEAHVLTHWLKAQPLETTVVFSSLAQGVPAPVQHTLRAEYERGYLQHASIGLCCALAQWRGLEEAQELEVWSHSQGIFNLRRDLALAFGLAADNVTVSHVEGAGCYGHNGADDVAFDAAWLAQHAGGRPVRVQWTREAEMGQAPMGPAMAVAIAASLDAEGRIASWTQDIWSQGHGTRPGRGASPSLLGAFQTASPAPVPLAVNAALAVGGGSERNGVPPYAILNVMVRNHRVLAMPLRVSALRALGAHANVFAAESFMDELAEQAGQDPLTFRLAHLQGDARALEVIGEVARLSAWSKHRADLPEGHGRGLAFARYKNTGAYCAVVADVVIDDAVRLRNLWIAADLGFVVHPDGARNQLEGGALQAASWSLCEAATFGAKGIESIDWELYHIFKFRDIPQVNIGLIERPDAPPLGAGECTAGPTAAAIGNAIFSAIGVRMRSMPMTADKLMVAAHTQ